MRSVGHQTCWCFSIISTALKLSSPCDGHALPLDDALAMRRDHISDWQGHDALVKQRQLHASPWEQQSPDSMGSVRQVADPWHHSAKSGCCTSALTKGANSEQPQHAAYWLLCRCLALPVRAVTKGRLTRVMRLLPRRS